jgi:hypothetical protein
MENYEAQTYATLHCLSKEHPVQSRVYALWAGTVSVPILINELSKTVMNQSQKWNKECTNQSLFGRVVRLAIGETLITSMALLSLPMGITIRYLCVLMNPKSVAPVHRSLSGTI